MAFKLGHSAEEFPENPDINLTPFIDVMLVLLIVFMIAAPLATADVHVDLPATAATAQPRPDKPVFLTLKADKTLSIGEAAVSYDDLPAALAKATADARGIAPPPPGPAVPDEAQPSAAPGDAAKNTDARLFLRADKTVSYEDLMKVMNLLRTSGYGKIGLVGLIGAAEP